MIMLTALLLTASSGVAGNDVDADIRAIRAMNQAYIELHPKADVDGLMEGYTDAPVLMPPGLPPVEGRAAVRASWEAFFDEVVVEKAESAMDEVIVCGDNAYFRGHYSETMRSKADRSTFVETGHFSGLAQRQADGSWKIARDMWNSCPATD